MYTHVHNKKRAKAQVQREETLNATPSPVKNHNDMRRVLEESSTVVKSENTGDGLSEAYYEIIRNSSASNILDTLSRLSQVCINSFERVDKSIVQNYWLAEEANTWRLLQLLHQDLITQHPQSIQALITRPALASEQTLIDALIQTDPELRLLQLLVNWLESTAENRVITSNNPEASKSENKTLHDQKNDCNICEIIFSKVRCGKSAEAVSLSLNAGNNWHWTVLQGWILTHHLPKEYPEEAPGHFNNIWKRCALQIADDDTINMHYRATFGIFCGHLKSVLPVCGDNWEDLVWVHLRTQIECRIHRFLHEHYLAIDANCSTPIILDTEGLELEIEKISIPQVFRAVKDLMGGKRESKYQTCQKYLIVGHDLTSIHEALLWLEESNEQFIRFIAHLVLVLRKMNIELNNNIAVKILEKYVTQLIEKQNEIAECPKLIAYYTSMLSVERQITDNDTLNLSLTLNETSLFGNLNDTSLRQILDESSIIVQSDKAGDSLSEAYFQIIRNSSSSNILDTLARLSQVCMDSFKLVRSCNKYNVQNYWLAEEASTWRLLQCLHSDFNTEYLRSDALIAQPTLSQQTLINKFFQSDPELRLLQLIVDWLEATAATDHKVTKETSPVNAYNVHWGNTPNQLLIGAKKYKNMVTCIDPDAPNRQKKVKHLDGQINDNDLYRTIFTKLRCGQFTDAISLCVSAGQTRCADIMKGWRSLHCLPKKDPNDWKLCALEICNNHIENVFYRAIIGILCGHLKSVLPLCQNSWEDLLWSHLRTEIECRVHKLLCKDFNLTVDANTTTPEVLEIDEMSIKQVFSAVKGLMGDQKQSIYQTCQSYLILDQDLTIIQEALQWLEESDERFVRFIAHLVLVLRRMGKDPDNISENIVDKYVTQLIENQNEITEHPELIAFYTSMMSVERQITLYAELMYKTHESESRKGVVKAGVNWGIDVGEAARVTVKKAIADIMETCGNMDLAFLETSVVEIDTPLIKKVISSLEWLSLIPNQLVEALWLCNAMIRTFISIVNNEAALACIESMNNMFPNFLCKVHSKSSELKEHLCLKAYLEASESFATWNRHSTSGKPIKVELLHPDASFADKMDNEQMCTLVEQQTMSWNAIVDQCRCTEAVLYNILWYPGGWLYDDSNSTSSPNFTDNEKKERAKHLDTLRRLCIKEVVTMISNCKVGKKLQTTRML